jgi:DNA-binding MarR family transcriptional regulator
VAGAPLPDDRPALDDLRAAVAELFAAQRQLRGRESQRRGPLTFAQYRLLLRLDESEGCTGNELAAAAGVSAASVTQMLDQLEAQGVVARERSLVDRRVVVARLTPSGRERLAAKRGELDAAWRAAFGELSDEELAQGALTARRIAAFLDTL